MSVLEELASAKQQYTHKIDAPNVFIPKTSVRATRAERLSGDIAGIIGDVAAVNKDQYELGLKAVEKIAIEDYAETINKFKELDSTKTATSSRSELARTAGGVLGSTVREFDDPDKQAVYDKYYTLPANNILATRVQNWALEDTDINTKMLANSNLQKTRDNAKELTSDHVTSIKDSHATTGRPVEEIDRELSKSLVSENQIEIDNTKPMFIKDDFTANMEILDAKFNDTFKNSKYATFKDGVITFNTEDAVVRDRINKAYHDAKNSIISAASNARGNMNKGAVQFAKNMSWGGGTTTDADGNMLTGYLSDKDFWDTFNARFPYADDDTKWKVQAIRAKSKDDNNEEVNAILSDSDLWGRPFSEPVLNNDKAMNKFYSHMRSTIGVMNMRDGVDPDTIPIHEKQMMAEATNKFFNALHSGNYDKKVLSLARGYDGSDEKEFKKLFDSPYAKELIYSNMSPKEVEKFEVRRHYINRYGSLPENYMDDFKKKEIELPDSYEENMQTMSQYMLYGTAQARIKYRALIKLGNLTGAEEMLSEIKNGFESHSVLGKSSDVKLHKSTLNFIRENKGSYDKITKLIDKKIIEASDDIKFIDSIKSNGVIILPMSDISSKNDSGKYIVQEKGRPYSKKVIIDISDLTNKR